MKFSLNDIFKKKEQTSITAATVDTTDYTSNDIEFKFIFNETSTSIPCNLISIGNFQECKISDTLTIYKNETLFTKVDFRYNYYSSSNKEAIKFGKFVAVGLSGHFYLYNLTTSTINLFIDLNGYFNSFKIYEKYLLVAYNSGIYCLNKNGTIKWHNSHIGLDGVIIEKIKEGKIYGHEQINPPDGWEDFILDFETGFKLD